MWKTVQLGDVAQVIAGQSPSGGHYNSEGYGTPFYQGKKDYGDRYLNPPKVWTTSVTKLAEKNDILISVRAPVGSLNIATERVCIGRGLAAIRPNSSISMHYLYYVLSLISVSLRGNAGAIFESINKKQIEAIEFVLPPLAEQQRIVEKLDRAFAEIDRAIELEVARKSEIKILKSAVIDAAFDGLDNETQMGKVFEFVRGPFGGSLKKGNFVESGFAVYEQQHAIKNQCTEFRYYVNQKKYDEMSRFKVTANSILMSCSGTIGKTTIIPDNLTEGIINQALLMIKPSKVILPMFAKLYMESKRFTQQLMDTVDGAAQQNVASVKVLKQISIPLPLLEQQEKIITDIEEINSRIEFAANLVEEALKSYIQLKSSILKQALQPPQQ